MFDDPLQCYFHPDRVPIEKCEICGKALCGYCLYYTEDGQRLCEEHAKIAKNNGVEIVPPAIYAGGIIPAQAQAMRQSEEMKEQKPKGVYDPQRPIYQGNNQDLQAFIAMLLGVFTIAGCCGGTYCFPFLAVLLGILAIVNAKEAYDPSRTRQQGMIALITGGFFTLVIMGCIVFYMVTVGLSLSANTSYVAPTYYFPTDTVTPAPTRTPSNFEIPTSPDN